MFPNRAPLIFRSAMFSTCLFCKSKLGANQAIEHFPVGKRLAFDAARGRLWVVCPRCRRWNLTPLEERWEAVEECERRFGGVRARFSTEQIGLARLPEGVELVRVGRPRRPEFAAWRYGERFTRRHRVTLAWGVGGLALMGAKIMGVAAVGVFSGAAAVTIYQVALFARHMRDEWMPLARVRAADGRERLIRGRDVGEVRLLPSEGERGWKLVTGRGPNALEIAGESEMRTAGQILSQLNRWGGSRNTVQQAVAELERVDHPHLYFSRSVQLLKQRHIAREIEGTRYDLEGLPPEAQLALEMAAHEEMERTALEGELQVLEDAWREAEEVAAIADRLTLPAAFDEFIHRHRQGGTL